MKLEYTLIDWLQVLLLLVGMPFISAIGAALGLMGRIRQGGFLPSIIAGLTGAAIASASLYLGIWTLRLEPTIDPKVFLEIYESGYQRHISFACLISTAVIAFLFAIAWRFRVPRQPPTRMSISLRTAMATQVLSLLCVGSWCGLRLLVLHSASPTVMTNRLWEERGWTIQNGNSLSLSGSGMLPSEKRAALAPSNLEDLGRFPALTQLFIADSDLAEIDLKPLAKVKQLTSINFIRTKVDKTIRNELSSFEQLTNIGLSELTTTTPTLMQLMKLPKFGGLNASKCALEREDLRMLLAKSKLQGLGLMEVDVYREGKVIDQWPPTLTFLQIHGGNLKREDLLAIGEIPSLTYLCLKATRLDDSVLEHFQNFRSLQTVEVTIEGIGERGFEIIALKMQPTNLKIEFGQLAPRCAAHLGAISKLQSLEMLGVILNDQDLEEIAKAPNLAELRITSIGLTEEGLLKFAHTPKLNRFLFPSFAGCKSFEAKFAAERTRLGLPKVALLRSIAINAKGGVSYSEP